jgi:hypothetical protein
VENQMGGFFVDLRIRAGREPKPPSAIGLSKGALSEGDAPMRRKTLFPLAGLAVAMAMAVGPASAAGQMKSQQDGQAQSAEGNCQAQPDQNKSDDPDDKTGSITKKLDKCGGVLQPPEVNDQGLVKPAPETGNMPIIKPGQVPDQAPKQE